MKSSTVTFSFSKRVFPQPLIDKIYEIADEFNIKILNIAYVKENENDVTGETSCFYVTIDGSPDFEHLHFIRFLQHYFDGNA